MNTSDILDERHETHGAFVKTADYAQFIKRFIRARIEMREGDGNEVLFDPDMEEALDMIATKIARIINGNPEEVDHWRDIAGYAQLVADRLEGKSR